MNRKTFCQVLLLFAVLLGISVVVVTQLYRQTVSRRDLLFRHAADRESDSVFRIFTRHIQNNEALASQFETYSETVYSNSSSIGGRGNGTGGIFRDSQGYDELFTAFHQFQHLSLTFRSQLGGIKAYAFAPRIYDDKRDEYEAASASLWNHFANRSIIPENRSWKITPNTSTNGFTYPVAFIEPQNGNANAINFDMSSVKSRNIALDAARHSLLSKLTAPLYLVDDAEGGFASLIVSPVVGKEDFATAAFKLFNVLSDAISQEFSTPGIKVHLWHMNTTGKEPYCKPGSSRSDSCYSMNPSVSDAHYLTDKSFKYVTGVAPDVSEALEVNGTLKNFVTSFLDGEPNYNNNLLVVYQMVVAQSEWALVVSGSNDFEVSLIPNHVAIIVCLVLINLVAVLIYAIFLHYQWKTGRLVRDSEKKAHTKLLGYMCHELRNPVHALHNLTVDLTPHSEEEQETVSLITATVGHMRDLVNGFIDFDKLNYSSTTKMNIEPRLIVVSEIVRDTFHQYKVLAEEGVELQACIPASLSDTEIYCDPVRLRQVLSNAMSNASKFVKHGSIILSMYQEDTGKHPQSFNQRSSNLRDRSSFSTCFGYWQNSFTVPVENTMHSNGTRVYEAKDQVLVIEVTDSGPGIGDATDGQLFTMYSMLDNNKLKRESNFDAGSGLGLSICNELALKMGGRISLTNRTDGIRGAVFKLTLPMNVQDEQKPQCKEGDAVVDEVVIDVTPKVEQQVSLIHLKVVVVEDDSVLRRVLKMMLSRMDLKPENVKLLEDGDQMISFLESAEGETFKPDLIITDIVMKRMNGDVMFELLKRQGFSIPIVAATGMAQEKQKYLDQGFDLVLLKPYALQDLKSILMKYVMPSIPSKNSLESE